MQIVLIQISNILQLQRCVLIIDINLDDSVTFGATKFACSFSSQVQPFVKTKTLVNLVQPLRITTS